MKQLFLVGAAILAVLALRKKAIPAGNLSPNFTLEELTVTNTGIANVPTAEERANLARLALEILEPMRSHFGPLRVTSSFRSRAVNTAIGGATSSEHMSARAADLYDMSGATAQDMIHWLYTQRDNLPLNQVIREDHTGHLHVSIAAEGQTPKRQFLQYDGSNYTTWKPGDVNV